MRTNRSLRSAGVTLLELLVTIAVIAILATIGIPSVQELIKNNRMDAQARDLVALLTFGRSEALRRNADVAVEIVGADNGWSGMACVGACPGDVIRSVEHDRVVLSQDVNLIFTNRGYLDAFAAGEVIFQLTHENCRGNRQRREMTIERTGQLTIVPQECGG